MGETRLPSDQEIASLFRRGAERFDQHVSAIAEDQWELPTPCRDWNVRQLVNHMVHELQWVPELFLGRTIEEVGDRFDGDLLGPDPKATCRSSVSNAIQVVEQPGAMDRIVHLSYGDVPGRHYAFEMSNDLWIHGWDLARAIGADERIDADAVEVLYRFYEPLEDGLKASGLFGPKVEPPAAADPQAKLLAVMGRRSW
jgi:uncharacterized protein (TIGR03086 family)